MLKIYRTSRDALAVYSAENFPKGTKVEVDQPGRYTGPGVVTSELCACDQVPVCLPNGNTWWYQIEYVKPAKP